MRSRWGTGWLALATPPRAVLWMPTRSSCLHEPPPQQEHFCTCVPDAASSSSSWHLAHLNCTWGSAKNCRNAGTPAGEPIDEAPLEPWAGSGSDGLEFALRGSASRVGIGA